MQACRLSIWDSVSVLLDAGASADCYDENDWQLIHYAAQSADDIRNSQPMDQATVDALQSQGVDTDALEVQRKTEREEFEAMVERLEQRGFSLNRALKDLQEDRRLKVDGETTYFQSRRARLSAGREEKGCGDNQPSNAAR